MSTNPTPSEFRVEKIRSHASITLTSGDTVLGCFFLSQSNPLSHGPERVYQLLNAEPGFFPFEVDEPDGRRVVQLNRAHVLSVTLAENEAQLDPGYDVARPRLVCVRLSNGVRVSGTVRVHQPLGRDRLSDWTRLLDQFRYVETDETTLIVNVAHVIEVSEVTHP